MNNKTVINIFGPSTAGKSTIADLLKGSIDRLYVVDFDVVKRQIMGYYRKRDGEIAREIAFDTLDSVARLGLTVLALLPPARRSEEYDRVAEIVRRAGYKLLDVEITAPDEVLIERYQKRLDSILQSGDSRKFKTLDEFKVTLKARYYRPDDTMSFDSSEKSPDEIFGELSNKLKLGLKKSKTLTNK